MADKRVFVTYWDSTKWHRHIFVTDDAPVIEYFEGRSKGGIVNGCGVVELPMTDYSAAKEDQLVSLLESKIGPRAPAQRIVAVAAGKVVGVHEHPDPERFMAAHSKDGVVYEKHADAGVEWTKKQDGSFEAPVLTGPPHQMVPPDVSPDIKKP